jgi:hypothetical protein
VTAHPIAPDDPSRPLPAASDEVVPINVDERAREVADDPSLLALRNLASVPP